VTLELDDTRKRVLLSKLRESLLEGVGDDDLCEKLQCSLERVQELKLALDEQEVEALRKSPTEYTYVEYVREQRRCMLALDKLIDGYRSPESDSEEGDRDQKGTTPTAFVSAVRTKSDIIDKIVKTGQEFGLIERASQGRGLIAGQAIFNLSHTEVKNYAIGELKALNEMMQRYGDQSIGDLDPGPLHLPVSVPKSPIKAHSRTTVFGGRRVVHEKETS